MKNEVLRVRASLRTASASALEETLANTKHAFYNADRRAVQFRSPCDPDVIADQITVSYDIAQRLQGLAAN